jgi:DNA-binding winged helix-turn-helix (wHTH) protein
MTAIVPAAEFSPAAEGSSEWTIPTGKLLVNLDTRFASVDGRPVHLTHKEYGILQLLCLRKGTTVTKQMFLEHLYGGVREPHLKIIDVFVCKLRKKLAELTGGKDYIETVWGRGYILRVPVAEAVTTIKGRARELGMLGMTLEAGHGPSRYDPTRADDPTAAPALRGLPETPPPTGDVPLTTTNRC